MPSDRMAWTEMPPAFNSVEEAKEYLRKLNQNTEKPSDTGPEANNQLPSGHGNH